MGRHLFVVAVGVLDVVGVERRKAEDVIDHPRLIVVRVDVVSRHLRTLIKRMVLVGVSVDSLALATPSMRGGWALIAESNV